MTPAASACRVGVGLRPPHYPHVLEKPKTPVSWFEAISENYMGSEGRPIRVLESVRREFPLALHGVSLSIGSVEGARPRYLKKLKALVERVQPFVVSDHLCWTGAHAANLHDLIPLPFTPEAVERVARNVEKVQSFLGRQIALENVSSYLTYKESTMTEWGFLTEVARRSGCRILLDVNNVFVNASNHGFDPEAYLDSVPAGLVAQIHLAGFTDMGDYLFDTHSRPVSERVWELFSRVIGRLRDVPVLIEWDEDIPPFPVLEKEAAKAARIWEEHHGARAPSEALR